MLLECALIGVRGGHRVLIVCPTGALVYAFKSMTPEEEGVDNIQVDTIQGLLKYKRPGPDTKHKANAWAPPSALRRIDDDKPWRRFHQSWKEQPHRPMVVVVADFQQLQPVELSERLCLKWCENQERVKLDTVYRTNDPEHLLFLNRIRSSQPDRATLKEYFGVRHWKQDEGLEVCVARGVAIADDIGKPFRGSRPRTQALLRYARPLCG